MSTYKEVTDSVKWHWMMDYCRRRRIPPANPEVWALAEKKWDESQRPAGDTSMNPTHKSRYVKPPFRGQKGRCCWCGALVLAKGRRTWCSQKCVDEYLLVSSPGYIRKAVHRRDKGICAICGINCTAAYRRWQESTKEVSRLAYRLINMHRQNVDFVNGKPVLRERRSATIRESKTFVLQMIKKYAPGNWTPGRSTGWDADHIVPVAEGGGQCDLANIRTLCHPCHKTVTARLAARLTEARRVSKQQSLIN